jgi:hypothetical protein
MNRYESISSENRFLETVFQTWDSHPARNYSQLQFASDPTTEKTAQFWNSRNWEKEYSSREKAYYPIVPYNTQTFCYAPVTGNFDFTRLKQTNVLDIVYSRSSQFRALGVVSLAHTVSSLINKIGTMENGITGGNLGTCTLIAHNLVLVARHAIENCDIQNINVTFGYIEYEGSFYQSSQTSFERIIEEDHVLDYAIIQLKEPLGNFVSLNIEGQTIAEPALLHYPLGKTLKVSVHTFVQTIYQTDYLLVYHDSDYFSSGGAYFDPMGRMIAMHLGAQLQEDTMNLIRYALPLEVIVMRNPNSLLGKLANGKLPQACSYTTESYSTFLAPTNHNYLIDEEGREAEKVLRALLKDELKTDKKIKRNKNGTITFSHANLEYIANNYARKFNLFEERCLGITGRHGFTHLYSVKGVIESDHTIPHNVWEKTVNPKMKKVLAGGGKRRGENDMPAITIPWEIHHNLLTTGGVKGYQAFHLDLIDLCDNDKIDDALILCYLEYRAKGLELKAYESEIKSSLDDYANLGLISNLQKKKNPCNDIYEVSLILPKQDLALTNYNIENAIIHNHYVRAFHPQSLPTFLIKRLA